ncbi:MAG: hypothetical protein P5684_24900, partial [Limnospira sp. PMC 1238.20]
SSPRSITELPTLPGVLRELMRSIKGIFKDGVIHPSEPISYPELNPVIITFLDASTTAPAPGVSSEPSESGWDGFLSVIEACQMETGISDLAHRRDRYLYGTPKHDEQET